MIPAGFKESLACSSDRELEPLIDKVLGDRPLDFEDGLMVLESKNLSLLGALADHITLQRRGERVFFAVNRHINYTNICDSKCNFCAYYREEGDIDAYTMSLSEILGLADEASRMGARELHIVGALNPSLPLSFFEEMLEEIHARYPEMGIKAFTAVEIAYMAEREGVSTREVLLRLKRAGLTCMPGGGAEILGERVRERLCPEKISGEEWLSIMEEAHSIGIPSNATILYGHIETYSDIVDHLLRLRDLQRRTHGFQAFIPLSFHPEKTGLKGVRGSTGFDDLKIIILSRLIFAGEIDNIKAYWVTLGPKLAGIALRNGANDLEGTIIEERITHAAGARTPTSLSKEDLINIIRDAGRVPVERTSTYETVKVYD
ncbi:FO synthase subunit 2 [Candidatus Methanoperedenaceae archaeon GB37]|nr:FO synthase subunit 2 [Candidatus Methanoperedenaceae archaeon GB37]